MNENQHKNELKQKGKELTKSAVAVAAAAGIALSGAFGGDNPELGHDETETISVVEMLNPDTDETDDGLVEDEKQKKGGQRRIFRALAVGLPFSVLCWWGVTALCALLPAGLPAFFLTVCKWVLTIVAALLALSVTLKVADPETPIVTSLRKSYKRILLLCLLFCCGEGALLWFFPQQAGHAGDWLRLILISATLVFLSLKAGKKLKEKPEDEAEEKEQDEREYILGLADSVSKKL